MIIIITLVMIIVMIIMIRVRPGRTLNRVKTAKQAGPAGQDSMSEKGEVLLRGVGTLRYFFLPNSSLQWQPDGLAIPIKKLLLGAGFLGAPPISLSMRCWSARRAFTRRLDDDI